MEVFLSTIMVWAPNFAPNNWILCQGQMMQIAQNTALFSLLQTTYGGDGITTYALPNFSSRVPVGVGTVPTLDSYKLGDIGGVSRVTLATNNLPAHAHDGKGMTASQMVATSAADTTLAVATDGSIFGAPSFPDSASGSPVAVNAFAPATTAGTVPLKYAVSGSTGSTGNGDGIDARSPYIAMNWIMALQGIYPSKG